MFKLTEKVVKGNRKQISYLILKIKSNLFKQIEINKEINFYKMLYFKEIIKV